jgi:hypothetical protein
MVLHSWPFKVSGPYSEAVFGNDVFAISEQLGNLFFTHVSTGLAKHHIQQLKHLILNKPILLSQLHTYKMYMFSVKCQIIK